MKRLVIVIMLFGCSSVPSSEELCESDLDCKNTYRCNLFFNMCEPDASDVSSIDVCMQFDQSGTIVELENDYGDLGQVFTVEAWVFPHRVIYDTDIGGIIFNRRAAYEDINLLFSRDQEMAFTFEVNGQILRGAPVVPDRWYHVVATFSFGEMSIFVNGVLQNRMLTSEEVRWNLPEPTGFYLGREGDPTDSNRGSFSGLIRAVQISDSENTIVSWTADTVSGVPEVRCF